MDDEHALACTRAVCAEILRTPGALARPELRFIAAFARECAARPDAHGAEAHESEDESEDEALPPMRTDDVREAAKRALRAGDADTAVRLYTDCIASQPDSALLHALRGEAHLAAGDAAAAIRGCDDAISRNADVGKAYNVRARAHARRGDWARARRPGPGAGTRLRRDAGGGDRPGGGGCAGGGGCRGAPSHVRTLHPGNDEDGRADDGEPRARVELHALDPGGADAAGDGQPAPSRISTRSHTRVAKKKVHSAVSRTSQRMVHTLGVSSQKVLEVSSTGQVMNTASMPFKQPDCSSEHSLASCAPRNSARHIFTCSSRAISRLLLRGSHFFGGRAEVTRAREEASGGTGCSPRAQLTL